MMHIAFCTDSNYSMPTGVAMISICENNKNEDICFHLVLTDDGSDAIDQNICKLLDIAGKYNKKALIYKVTEETLQEYKCLGATYVSTTAFSRIFLSSIIPSDVTKILYLDCDIIVNGSLVDLWNTKLDEDCPIGAVIDAIGTSPTVRCAVQTPLSVQYCNSGVLLMNLSCWRKECLSDKISKCAIENKYPLLDQDAIHCILGDRTKILPVKYNVQTNFIYRKPSHWMIDYNYYEEVKKALLSPVLIHYVSGNKPWKTEYCPMQEYWDKYFNLSCWNDITRQNTTCSFDMSTINKKLEATYWNDIELFYHGMNPMIDLLNSAIKIRHKECVVKISAILLNLIKKTVDCYYGRKQKN